MKLLRLLLVLFAGAPAPAALSPSILTKLSPANQEVANSYWTAQRECDKSEVALAVQKKKLSKIVSESKEQTVEEKIFGKSKAKDLQELKEELNDNLSLNTVNSRGCFSVETLTLLILLNAKANEKGAIDIIGSFVQLNVAVLANQINNAIRGIILERRGGTGRAL